MKSTKQQEVLQKVVSEAWDNPTFKQELIASPEEAIQRLTGTMIKLPEGKTFQVIDQSNPNVVSLTIPPKPNTENVELTDDQLEAVAGGCYAEPGDGKSWGDLIFPPDGGGCFPPYDDIISY